MKLIDDQIVVIGDIGASPAPVEGVRIIDDGVAGGIDNALAAGIFLSVLFTTYLYSWPARAFAISTDQLVPPASFVMAVLPQPLNCPLTETLEAFGAHVRKVTPVPPASA